MGFVGEQLFPPNRKPRFDAFDDLVAGFDSHFPMFGRSENEQADFAHFYRSEAVVNVHASQREFGENFLSDLVHFLQCHFFISRVFDGRNGFSANFIGTDLSEENAVRADICFRRMLGDAVGDKRGIDRAVYEYVLNWFFHVKILVRR